MIIMVYFNIFMPSNFQFRMQLKSYKIVQNYFLGTKNRAKIFKKKLRGKTAKKIKKIKEKSEKKIKEKYGEKSEKMKKNIRKKIYKKY